MIRKWGYALRRSLVKANRRLKRSDGLAWLLSGVRRLLLYVVVLVFLMFEEIWDVLHDVLFRPRVYQRGMAWLNGFSAGQNRYVVLLIYLSLFIPMEILGLMSAALAASGQMVLAVLVYASKGLIAVPAIDVFTANAEKLRSFAAIEWAYQKIQQLKHSSTYLAIVDRLKWMKSRIRQWIDAFRTRSG